MNTNKKSSLLRKESFGGTLGNAVSGRRIYINNDEFQSIKSSGRVTQELCIELRTNCTDVIIREPELLSHNFSAPDIIFFELTRACNLRCTHCLNNSGKSLLLELTHEQIDGLLDDLCTVGVQEVRFTGGEPLLNKDIFGYISKIRKCGLRASIGTNGVLVDDTVARKLSEADLNVAIVSVDGLENQHDDIRGKGSFNRVLRGIESLNCFDIPVRVNIVAMKSNLLDIPSTVQYFHDRGIKIMIRRLIPSGRASVKEMLSAQDYVFLRKELDTFLSVSNSGVSGHYLKEDVITPRVRLPFAWCKCKAGRRGLAIHPDGRVSTCGFLEPLNVPCVGNLGAETLSSIWKGLQIPLTNCIANIMSGCGDPA
jgi:MoaA/NifB/PqqE/SkfB family radical SAM enzyme